MRELLFGFQITAWLLALVFGLQLTLTNDEQLVNQALLILPYAVLAASALTILSVLHARGRHRAETEVTFERLRRKHPQLFRSSAE